jgi:predicted dehydrogenase
MGSHKKITRRSFLKKSTSVGVGVLGFPYIVSSSALGEAGNSAASERITLGFIGAGSRGFYLLRNFMPLKDTQVIAVCDVKQTRREKSQKAVDEHYGEKVCAVFNDFRELCGRIDIDAVVVASTDHWHVLHALEAVRAGKDVYCEKPLGPSIEQGKMLRQEVNRYNRVLQFGSQERSSRNTRFACEMVLSGRVGKIHTIKVGSRSYTSDLKDFPPMQVPDGFDYDMWLGPAPWAPYTANRVSPAYWFNIRDYSLGFMAGTGIHTIDMATWGNGTQLTGPVEIEGTGEIPSVGLCGCPTGWDVNLKFANGVTMNFSDEKKNPLGVRFEGADGWVSVKEEHLGGSVDAEPKELLQKEIGPDEVHLPQSNHHQQNFLDCVRSRAKPIAPIESAVRSDTLCHLSDIAIRTGRKLNWDPEKEKFINDEQANRLLKLPLRSPWHL